jgi:trehalose-phosphatase
MDRRPVTAIGMQSRWDTKRICWTRLIDRDLANGSRKWWQHAERDEVRKPMRLGDAFCTELALCDQLALLLDLDGTIIPFASTTEAANLDQETIARIEAVRRTNVTIVMVTGRLRAHVEPQRAMLPHVCWMAEHGNWCCCDPSGEWRGPAPMQESDDLERLFAPFRAQEGTRFELKSTSACLHWRMVPPDVKAELIARVEAACDAWLATHPDFERLDGVQMIEVRRRGTNKAAAVAWVRTHVPRARIIAIGDDHTDEDMFAALRHDELAICVGERRTRARCRLPDPSAVHAFLSWLRETRAHGFARPFSEPAIAI